MHVHTLIIGGGLTGLSTAYHLEKAGHTDYLLVEKESVLGGLARSIERDRFIFDCSGHLLHLHTRQGKQLVRQLLPRNLARLQRQAWIYTRGTYVPYPFQAHLFALPPQQQKECLVGLQQAARRTYSAPPKNFEQWCMRQFGKGIYKHFMRPYNTKLWGVSPRELTCEWCQPFVPVPPTTAMTKPEENSRRKWGYNASFYYPKKGGCGALVQALANPLHHVRTGAPLIRLNLQTKTAVIGRQTVTFDRLVNTLPLASFITLLENEPKLQQKARVLRAGAVNVYHLAVRGKVKPFHWVYFPDEDCPFYRVGQQSAFSPKNAPRGCHSFYIELPAHNRPSISLEKRIWKALLQKGIIDNGAEKLFSFWQPISCAYVLYDKKRTRTVDFLLKVLQQRGCYCAGRYGRWEYSFMERSLLEGKYLAKELR